MTRSDSDSDCPSLSHGGAYRDSRLGVAGRRIIMINPKRGPAPAGPRGLATQWLGLRLAHRDRRRGPLNFRLEDAGSGCPLARPRQDGPAGPSAIRAGPLRGEARHEPALVSALRRYRLALNAA